MSIESAKSFIDRMKTDEEFVEKVSKCKDAEERMMFVKSAGFDFTSAEIKMVAGKLTDGDLAAVMGGTENPGGPGSGGGPGKCVIQDWWFM